MKLTYLGGLIALCRTTDMTNYLGIILVNIPKIA